ncbi:MAG TPA: hypothetical protein VK607_20710 [Kofleriaceae bacterium]|nr:hypothetical protein [Kofleriaceae bacterium]
MARDEYGDGIELLARLLRRRFGRSSGRQFVVLAADIRGLTSNDQETIRIPVLQQQA